MKANFVIGRSFCFVAALAVAMPAVAQEQSQTVPLESVSTTSLPTTVEATPSEGQLDDLLTTGLPIPQAEADQMRGGGWATVLVKLGRKYTLRIYKCASRRACRNMVIREFGANVAFDLVWSSTKSGARWVACRFGYRQYC
jgi:hypothetical protein